MWALLKQIALLLDRESGPRDRAKNATRHREVRVQALAVRAAIAEYSSLREAMVFQMDRANRLATFGIGGAAAILTFLAGQHVAGHDLASAYLLITFGLAIVTFSYVGVIGEEMQIARYLRAQGRWVRDQLDTRPTSMSGLPDLNTPPVLAWEELMAQRAKGPRWLVATSTLAALELGGTALFGLVLFVVTLFTDPPNAGMPVPLLGLYALHAVAVPLALIFIIGLLRLQRSLADT